HDFKITIAFKHDSGIFAANGSANELLNRREAEPAASDLRFIDINREDRQAGDLLDFDVSGTRHSAQNTRNLPGGPKHQVKIVAEYFDRNIAAHTGQKLIETHLDWLGKLIIVAWQLPYTMFHLFKQPLFASSGSTRSSTRLVRESKSASAQPCRLTTRPSTGRTTPVPWPATAPTIVASPHPMGTMPPSFASYSTSRATVPCASSSPDLMDAPAARPVRLWTRPTSTASVVMRSPFLRPETCCSLLGRPPVWS